MTISNIWDKSNKWAVILININLYSKFNSYGTIELLGWLISFLNIKIMSQPGLKQLKNTENGTFQVKQVVN